jgi:ABC-type sugar transport system ATPase subunit
VTEARPTAPDESAESSLVELVRVSRAFGVTLALDGVSLSLAAGEVHVLAGENGAGKSTLIRILSGADQGYTGVLKLGGRPVRLANPRAARRLGIATIHQELSLLPNLSATENLLLATEGPPWQRADRKSARARALAAFARIGLELDPDVDVERLTLGERQLVEIARALDGDARLVIMDEPTSALTDGEASRLFETITRLRREEASVLYITHRMDEIARLADRVSVLRDGKLVRTAAAAEISHEELVFTMLGRKLGARSPELAAVARGDVPRLVLTRVSVAPSSGSSGSSGRARALEDVSLALHAGEILGLTGLAGSGAERVLALLSGDARASSGSVTLDGSSYTPAEPRAAFARGVAHLPNDRKKSVLANLRLFENVTLSSLHRYSPLGVLRRPRELAAFAREQERVRVKARGPFALASELSGGNQQKLAVLRCLMTEPRVLLLDDPTRGVDLGARADLHELIRELASRGLAVLVHGTDLDELCSLCQRVLVFRRGRVATELEGDALTRERLLTAQSRGAT